MYISSSIRVYMCKYYLQVYIYTYTTLKYIYTHIYIYMYIRSSVNVCTFRWNFEVSCIMLHCFSNKSRHPFPKKFDKHAVLNGNPMLNEHVVPAGSIQCDTPLNTFCIQHLVLLSRLHVNAHTYTIRFLESQSGFCQSNESILFAPTSSDL